MTIIQSSFSKWQSVLALMFTFSRFIYLRGRENEQHAAPLVYGRNRAQIPSRGSLIMRSIGRGYGWGNDRRATLRPKRRRSLLRMVGGRLRKSSFDLPERICSNTALIKYPIHLSNRFKLTSSLFLGSYVGRTLHGYLPLPLASSSFLVTT